MGIRKRLSGNGPEDGAVREALRLATVNSERRIAVLEEELKSGEPFDRDESQKEIDTLRKHLAVWRRLSSTEGKLKVVVDAS